MMTINMTGEVAFVLGSLLEAVFRLADAVKSDAATEISERLLVLAGLRLAARSFGDIGSLGRFSLH